MGYGALETPALPNPPSEAVWWVVRPKTTRWGGAFLFVMLEPRSTCHVLAKSWFDARAEGSLCLGLEYGDITIELERK